LNTGSDSLPKVEKKNEQNVKSKTLGEKLRSMKGCYIASLSPGLIPGLDIGFGWITSDSTSNIKENIITLHANAIKTVGIAGISITINKFQNLDRTGVKS